MRILPLVLALATTSIACKPAADTRVASTTTSRTAGQKLGESDKIESLIQRIETLPDAKFIRNGTEYGPAVAAKFMRGKWDRNRNEIKTARDFIRVAATKSSTTGRLYVIKFADGSTQGSAEFLTKKLEEIDK